MKIKFLFILLTISLFACQSEPAEEKTPQEEAPTPVETTSPKSDALGKMVKIQGSQIELDNTQKVDLDAEDAVTLFLVRHAETMEGKTSLSGPGRAHTGQVANLFLGKNLRERKQGK